MNLLSLLIAPLQAVVMFFAPHAVGAKPLGLRMPLRALAPTASGASDTPVPSRTADSGARAPVAHARITYPLHTARISAKPIHRVRVVRSPDSSLPADRAGRMLVSGTFADVCAELDRLAASELRAA